MGIHPWENADSAMAWQPEQLAAMDADELIGLIYRLESREATSDAIERDHRRYLEKHELVRLVRLTAGLRRKPMGRASMAGYQG